MDWPSVPFFVLFLQFGWCDRLRQDLLHQLGHHCPSKQGAIKIAAGLANRLTRGRYGRDLNCLHHTQNNPTTKIRDFCPVAFSCKAGHSSFTGDNLKKRLQNEHCVCKRRGIQGRPHTELMNFCTLLRTLLPFPTPGPKKLIHFLNLFFFAYKHTLPTELNVSANL